MVSPQVRFQLKGKKHISYICEWATSIWIRNKYNIKFAECLKEALRRHREYLETGKYSN